MRILIYLFLFGALLSTGSSCKEKPKVKTELDILYEQVMEIHDEVMPLMSDMNKNERELKKYINPEFSFSDTLKNNIRTGITNLENTSEAMMDWMSNFKKPKNDDGANAKTYLEDQKMRISKISKAMKLSYEKSTILLYDLRKSQNQ